MPDRTQPLRIAVDTGGTFTDCVWVDPASGRLRMLKVFSTPADPSKAIIEALRKIAHHGEFILLHGTTVGTNTLLERKGARTALVTTAGFEDVIEIGRQARPELYDFFFDRVEPLVARDLRFGVEERTAYDGEILTAPSPEDLKSLASRVAATHPQAVAISLLFSFADPKNELAVAKALRPLGVPLSISHEILPEFREYERTSTVVVNAYLQPVMKGYLESLQFRANELAASESKTEASEAEAPIGRRAVAALKRRSSTVGTQNTRARIFVMQSNGGIAALAAAAREPVRTVLSGPAGGVVGAAATARASGFERVIAFDMGGTSTDVSLVDGAIATAVISTTKDAQVAGLPVGVPMLDIHTVGAGGGSLARFDAGGVLRVGPESAGADPGPICYGRGLQPTVTDANLLLGRLQAEHFLGGEFKLDLDRTRTITQAWLKKQKSRLTLEQFADGVIRVVNATMEKAIRVVSVERGRDPRDYALVAFGGAGGLHACALAEALGIPQVIVPALPGALSALGILASDVVKDYSRTVLWRVSGKIPHARLDQEFSELEKQAARIFKQEGWHGKARYEKSVDVRYRGQGYELSIPLSNNLVKEFEREHQRRYGYVHPNREVELVTLRLRAVVKSPKLDHVVTGTLARPGRARLGSLSTLKARVFFDGKKLETKIYSRDALQPRKKYSGPAIITEYSAATVIPPGKHFHIDRPGNLIITIR
ncbi:MAG TPA: hydantoinase/oxoprolinase family protein [Candidatus Sulfotelmatobacter sp.]|nr:hydantoinase/oxoprolinase family protein [Candidatus Sulfotelmatobacter sp.]